MIELITTSIFVLTSVYGGPTITTDTGIVSTTTAPEVYVTVNKQETNKILTSKELEQKAKEYFKNDPILVDIARCESSFRQTDSKGNILRGKINKGDIGLMQINEYYHADKAKELKLNLHTVEGNMAYAKYLYDKEGVKPWISSSKCWNDMGDQVALNR
jgi:ATP sulfurylase